MRKAQRWRYYCDYCKKSSGRMGGMEIHEKYCTMNPKRGCRICKNPSDPVEVGKSALNLDRVTCLIEIRAACNNCPACILAVLRQSGLGYSVEPWFDFKAEMEKRWDSVTFLADGDYE